MAENSDDDSLLAVEPEIDDPADKPKSPSETERRRTTAELTVRAERIEFSGPLPHPDLLKSYNGAFAGCAERVVAMAERQSAHRQRLETMVVEGDCKAQSRGQWFAFVLALVVVAGGVYLLAQGKSIEGFSTIIIALASLIGVFAYAKWEQRKERERKARPLPRSSDSLTKPES